MGTTQRIVAIDGRIGNESELGVSPFDHGLLTGDGIFETVRVYRGAPFALRRHLDRLARSAQRMDLAVPADLRAVCAEVIAANDIAEGRLRITLTGGPGPLGSARGSAGPTCIVAAEPVHAWPATTDVVTVEWPRNERGALAGVKSTSHGENVVAWKYAVEKGAGEAIFGNTVGNLCEGTGSNIFVVINDELLTPPLHSGCLAGVTRDLIIEITGAAERDIPLASLVDVEEAFLTSTTREVQPISAVDGSALPAAPGRHARRAAELFSELLARTQDP